MKSAKLPLKLVSSLEKVAQDENKSLNQLIQNWLEERLDEKQNENFSKMQKIFKAVSGDAKPKLNTDANGQFLIPGSRDFQRKPKEEILLIQWNLQED